MAVSMLEIDGVTLWYESLSGDVRALDRCSLSLEEGQTVGLLGANGAGKSSLFLCLSGVVRDLDGRVTAGRLRFQDMELTRAKPAEILAAGLAQAPQNRHIFHTLSVEDNLLLGGYVRRRKPGGSRKLRGDLDRIYGFFPVLGEKRRQKSGTLSGGEQQMLSIGRALMADPALLLLDEPFLGLSLQAVENIGQALEGLKGSGLTLLIAEQNASGLDGLADRGLLMSQGFVVAEGRVSDLALRTGLPEDYFGEKQQ